MSALINIVAAIASAFACGLSVTVWRRQRRESALGLAVLTGSLVVLNAAFAAVNAGVFS